MKSYRIMILSTAALVAGGFSVARAEASAGAAQKQPAAETSTAKKPKNRIENLTQKLHLTDAQQLKVAAVVKDEQAEEAALKANTEMTADVKKAKHREIVKTHNEQIRAILTPEQQPTFDQMTSHHFGAKK